VKPDLKERQAVKALQEKRAHRVSQVSLGKPEQLVKPALREKLDQLEKPVFRGTRVRKE
jgi:hypothetical protein